MKRESPLKLPRGIRRKPNGKFIGEVSYKGERQSVTKNTIEEAMAARDTLLEKMMAAHREKEETMETWSLQEAFDWTWNLRWKAQKSQKIKMSYKDVLEFFGAATPVPKITTDRVDAFVKHLIEKNNADGTINRKVSCLSTILTTAFKRGKITALPVFSRRKESEGRIRFLTDDEEKILLGWFLHLGRTDHAEACAALLDTGFRTGELWRVEARSVNAHQRTITIWETKADKPRTIPMTERVNDIITRRCAAHPKGPLWPEGDNDWLHRQWQKVRELMGLLDDPQFVPHALRHTCCSRLVQRGVPLLHVQQWMGHKSIQTTMRYAHLAPHDLFSLAHVLQGGSTARWQSLKDTPQT